MQTVFADVSLADAVLELLEMRKNPLHVPATADIMADDRMKRVAAVGSFRRAVADYLLNLINAVAGAIAVKAVAIRYGCVCSSSLAAFAPNHAPVEHLVDVGEFANSIRNLPQPCCKWSIETPKATKDVQHLGDLHGDGSPELQGLSLCKYRERNGGPNDYRIRPS